MEKLKKRAATAGYELYWNGRAYILEKEGRPGFVQCLTTRDVEDFLSEIEQNDQVRNHMKLQELQAIAMIYGVKIEKDDDPEIYNITGTRWYPTKCHSLREVEGELRKAFPQAFKVELSKNDDTAICPPKSDADDLGARIAEYLDFYNWSDLLAIILELSQQDDQWASQMVQQRKDEGLRIPLAYHQFAAAEKNRSLKIAEAYDFMKEAGL